MDEFDSTKTKQSDVGQKTPSDGLLAFVAGNDN